MATKVVNPSPHAEEVKVLLEKVRAFRAEIPRFIQETPGDIRRLVPLAALSDEFLESASVSIQTFQRLEQAAGTDATTLRDAFSFALAFDALAKELRALSRAVTHTIRVQKAEAAKSALDVYAIAQRLAGQKDGAELLPYVEDMRQKLNKRPRKTTSNPAPAPLATTAPSPKS